MAGEKTFVNNSPATLQITLFVRQGNDPVNQGGTVSFALDPGQTQLVVYGDDQNPFLNGILSFTIFNGDLYSKMQFATAQDSELDDLTFSIQTTSLRSPKCRRTMSYPERTAVWTP